MCAIYKVSRRKIERGVSWPVRQKASEACNLFLLQAGSIRPSPLGAIHRGDGHIYFLRYINMFWCLETIGCLANIFIPGRQHPTNRCPPQRPRFREICDLWQNLSSKKCLSQTFTTCLWIKTRYFVPLLVYPVMLKLYTGVPLLLVIIATQ